jgi:hypothetical protein
LPAQGCSAERRKPQRSSKRSASCSRNGSAQRAAAASSPPRITHDHDSARKARRRQTLERKAAFIAQVIRGDLPDRDVDDIGDQALSFAEVKALATGDPLVLEKAGVDADVARLIRLERSYHDDQHRLRRTLAATQDRAARSEERIHLVAVNRVGHLEHRPLDAIDNGGVNLLTATPAHMLALRLQVLDSSPQVTLTPSLDRGGAQDRLDVEVGGGRRSHSEATLTPAPKLVH